MISNISVSIKIELCRNAASKAHLFVERLEAMYL